MDKGIWVTGSGSAAGPRDECSITVGAEVRRATADAALQAVAEATAALRGVLEDAAIPAAAIATSAVSLNPVYEQYPTVAGYQAAIQLTARTADLDGVGPLLTALVVAGGDAARISEVAYRHRDSTGLLRAARDAAWADAVAKASQLAGLAGRELGDVLAIDETVGAARPPMPVRMAAAAADAEGTRLALDAGEGAVSVTLTVGWSMR
ncbi:MAG TPA: SIMPL domain-containing protein [Candidatus Nanopelagicales bacterium]